jgi:hypothetical protein
MHPVVPHRNRYQQSNSKVGWKFLIPMITMWDPHDNNVGLRMLSLPPKIHNIFPYHPIIHDSQNAVRIHQPAVTFGTAPPTPMWHWILSYIYISYKTNFKIDTTTHRLDGKIWWNNTPQWCGIYFVWLLGTVQSPRTSFFQIDVWEREGCDCKTRLSLFLLLDDPHHARPRTFGLGHRTKIVFRKESYATGFASDIGVSLLYIFPVHFFWSDDYFCKCGCSLTLNRFEGIFFPWWS